MRSMRTIVMVAAGALLLATSALAAPPDAWVTAKTKMALLTTEGVSGTGINVDTVDGTVTLHGKVPSTAEKAKAEAEAKKIDGVKEVRRGSADDASPSRWYTVWTEQEKTGAVLIALCGSDMVETAEHAKKRYPSTK